MPASKRNTAPSSPPKRDRDGWLLDPKTGALIGPDPAIERELTDEELTRVKPRTGRPPLPAERRRTQISMRFAPETIAALRALGPGFNAFAEEAIKRALKRARR
jgi:hypothetical protein